MEKPKPTDEQQKAIEEFEKAFEKKEKRRGTLVGICVILFFLFGFLMLFGIFSQNAACMWIGIVCMFLFLGLSFLAH